MSILWSDCALISGIQETKFNLNAFHPDYDNTVLPAHVYLRSVHNISIEQAWLRMLLDFGNNAIIEYEKGATD